jgi:SAM-dependent methyltransferase
LFLDEASPSYLGTIATFLASSEMIDGFRDVAALVQKGGTLNGTGVLTPEEERWVQFAHAMMPVAALAAQTAAPVLALPGREQKVLDIGAGSGMFGISIARLNPAAEVVAVDWGNVLQVARENATLAGVNSRYRTIEGDALTADLGSDYDLVLIPNFLHHFDPHTNVQLLRRVRAAMSPGSHSAIIDFVPNDDRVSPAIPAAFSLQMLSSTAKGDAYTFRELDHMVREAGFSKSKRQELLPTPLTLILAAA